MFAINYIDDDGILKSKSEQTLESALNSTKELHKPVSINEFDNNQRIVSSLNSKTIYNLLDRTTKSETSNEGRHIVHPVGWSRQNNLRI